MPAFLNMGAKLIKLTKYKTLISIKYFCSKFMYNNIEDQSNKLIVLRPLGN